MNLVVLMRRVENIEHIVQVSQFPTLNWSNDGLRQTNLIAKYGEIRKWRDDSSFSSSVMSCFCMDILRLCPIRIQLFTIQQHCRLR